jgi:hypothetical protein
VGESRLPGSVPEFWVHDRRLRRRQMRILLTPVAVALQYVAAAESLLKLASD